MAPKVKLTLNNDACKPTLNNAAKKKRASQETLEEAWARIEALKNSDSDKRMIADVKAAMLAEKIGREPESVAKNKRLSKAELKRLYPKVKELKQAEILAEMVDSMPKNYWLVQTKERLDELLELLDQEELIVFDVETTGTNVYRDYLVGHVITATK
ncbi:DNA polymerase I, partial [Listeria floridensis FSL S10-1187]